MNLLYNYESSESDDDNDNDNNNNNNNNSNSDDNYDNSDNEAQKTNISKPEESPRETSPIVVPLTPRSKQDQTAIAKQYLAQVLFNYYQYHTIHINPFLLIIHLNNRLSNFCLKSNTNNLDSYYVTINKLEWE